MTDYNAIVTRSAPGWSIYVPEVERHTYAAHLREIEEMSRDLVQVMTDIPIGEIHVVIHLPADLAGAITHMRVARESAAAAERVARAAQQEAVTALRDSGAALRDIAAALDLSHQRAHQILEEAADRNRQLEEFRRKVVVNLERGVLVNFELPVTDDDGGTPIVVAFVDESLSKLIERVNAVGGYANVFVKDGEAAHFVTVVDEVCAIADADDRMVGDEAPSPFVTIGMFLEHVRRHPNGVTISAVLGHSGCARGARQVDVALA